MGKTNLLLGQKGEDAALQFLLRNGYDLEIKNFKTPFAEIDIIARHEGFLCFVEVKTRTSKRKGLPREAVNVRKQRKIISAATAYIKQTNQTGQRIRFDVLEVFACSKDSSMKNFNYVLIPGAFQAEES